MPDRFPDRALDAALITAPDARDPELLKKLDAVMRRVNAAWDQSRVVAPLNAPKPSRPQSSEKQAHDDRQHDRRGDGGDAPFDEDEPAG